MGHKGSCGVLRALFCLHCIGLGLEKMWAVSFPSATSGASFFLYFNYEVKVIRKMYAVTTSCRYQKNLHLDFFFNI